MSLLIFLSVAGNILVCIAIYTDRGLRRIGNLFLASLAIADLFVASLVINFPLKRVHCKLNHFRHIYVALYPKYRETLHWLNYKQTT